MVIRLLTWNLQGSKGVDVEAVVATISAQSADVVVLQEVQRVQARRLARRLALRHVRWTFKHWPVVSRAEGMAIMTKHPAAAFRSYVVGRAAWWSWRRRVALEADIDVDGHRRTVVCVHLSPHGAAVRRSREIEVVQRRSRWRVPVLAGDFNDEPSGPARAALLAGGWRDAWTDRHGAADGATNWTLGERAGRLPTQRLDYVFVPAQWSVAECRVIDAPLDALAKLSDHLPVLAVVDPPGGGDD